MIHRNHPILRSHGFRTGARICCQSIGNIFNGYSFCFGHIAVACNSYCFGWNGSYSEKTYGFSCNNCRIRHCSIKILQINFFIGTFLYIGFSFELIIIYNHERNYLHHNFYFGFLLCQNWHSTHSPRIICFRKNSKQSKSLK